MADKKEILRVKDSVATEVESKMPCKFVVEPIDWRDIGLTEKQVHALLYEDEENSSNQRPISTHLRNGKDSQWQRSVWEIDWNDIGMTEKEVMELMGDGCDESYKEDFPIKELVDHGAKTITFVSEAPQSLTVNNDNEEQGLMSSAHDNEASDGEIIDDKDDDDASTSCQLLEMMLSDKMLQEAKAASRNEDLVQSRKTVQSKKNIKDIRRRKEIYPTTQTNVSISKTSCLNTRFINGSNELKDNDNYKETVNDNISTDSDISYCNDNMVKQSTKHGTKLAVGNECKNIEVDSMKSRKGSKGVIGNSLKRKFQETRDQGNCFDGISPRKTRRLEKIEAPNFSDTAYMKKPKRKCVFLSLGIKDTNQTTKSTNQKKRRWRS